MTVILLSIMLATTLAPAEPTLGPEERAIIEAVLVFRPIQPESQTLIPTALPLFVFKDNPKVQIIGTQEVVAISAELVAAMRENNQQRVSLEGMATAQTTRESWVSLSRPGISKDGLTAIIVIHYGDHGYVLYLEKRKSVWSVTAQGLNWIF